MHSAACISGVPTVARVGDAVLRVSSQLPAIAIAAVSCCGSAFFLFSQKHTEQDDAFAVDVRSAKGSKCNERREKEQANEQRE